MNMLSSIVHQHLQQLENQQINDNLVEIHRTRKEHVISNKRKSYNQASLYQLQQNYVVSVCVFT
jgi:hypothetical protein